MLAVSLTSSSPWSRASIAIGIVVLSLQALLLLKYYLLVRRLVEQRTERRKQYWFFEESSLSSLEFQLSYLTQRFAPHAPYWQFAIFTRQLVLTLVACVSRVILEAQQPSHHDDTLETIDAMLDEGARRTNASADGHPTVAGAVEPNSARIRCG